MNVDIADEYRIVTKVTISLTQEEAKKLADKLKSFPDEFSIELFGLIERELGI